MHAFKTTPANLQRRPGAGRRATALAMAIQIAFGPGALRLAQAGPVLPQGATVVNGQVSMANPTASSLQINASSGAIVNWRTFSIGAGGQVQIGLPSATSAMLNRVTGAEASQLLGSLQSNGRIFLINPNGIMVGAGARIDTNSFIASTLDMSDGDFLAGKLRFLAAPGAGAIRNDGVITAGPGGRIALIAPDIQNTGIIQAPGGQILLAAGRKLEISSLDFEGVTFEIQAPTDSVLNLGQLLADNGAVSAFAGSLRNSGEIRANRLVRDADGSVRLAGSSEFTQTSDGRVSADGLAGGNIVIQSRDGTARVAGLVSATGSDGKGGSIAILGNRVAVEAGAVADASGSTGGGQVLVGGDFQGANAAVQNASRVYVAPGASLKADATDQGDGGKVVVWADENTRFYGDLSVQGGPNGGNGGAAEVSGKQNLAFDGSANLGAAQGQSGTLLLDPLDIVVNNAGGILPSVVDQFSDFAGNVVTISPTKMAAINGIITLQAARDVYFMDPVALTFAGAGLNVTAGGPTFNSVNGGNINMAQSISTTGGAVTLRGVSMSGPGTITTAGGAVNLTTSGNLTYSSAINSGNGAVTLTSTNGSINSANVNAVGGTILANSKSGVFNGTFTTTDGVTLTTSAGSISNNVVSSGTANLAATGGFVSSSVFAADRINASSTTSSVQLNSLSGQALHLGAVTANSGVFVTGAGGVDQASGGLITTSLLSVNTSNSGFATGSGGAPLRVAAGNSSPDVALQLQNLGAPAYVALTGSPNLSQLNMSGSVAALGGSVVSGASNITSLGLADGGTVLNANAVATGPMASGFSMSVNNGGFTSTNLDLAGTNISLSSQGPMNLGTVTGASLNASAAGPVTIGTATTSGNSGINVTAQKCNLSFSVCTDVSPVTVGTLTANGFGSVSLTSRDNGDVSATSITTAGGSISVSAGSQYNNSSDRGPNFNKRFVTTGNVNLGTLNSAGSVQVNNRGIGDITISNPVVAASGVSVQGGVSYNHDGNNGTPNILTPTNINVAGLTGTSVSIGNSGTGLITSTGNLVATSSSLSVSAVDGPISATGANSSQSSTSISSSTGSVTLGTITTVNSNAGVSVTAGTDISFQSITAPGVNANVTLSAGQGSIKTLLDNTTADISTGGNVTLTANNGTNGVIGDASFARPMDIVAGAAKTVSLSAGKNIGDVGKAVHINTNGSVSATTVGGQFFVSVDDLAGTPKTLTNIALSASATGMGIGGTSTFASQDLSINATSDGSAINIGNVVQGANRLDKFSFTAAGSGLNFDNVSLTTATGFNQLALASAGPMTQSTPGTNNVLAGRMSLNSGGGDITLGDVTSTSPVIQSPAFDNSITISGGNVTTRNLLAQSINVSGANLTLGNGVAVDSVKTTGTNRGFPFVSFDSAAGQYPFDSLTLSASGTLSTAWNVTSATTASLSGNGVTIGGSGAVNAGHFINTSFYIDTANISSGTGALNVAGVVAAADVNINGNSLNTAAVTADRLLSMGNSGTSSISSGVLTGGSGMTLNSGSFATGNMSAGTGALTITANATGSQVFAPSVAMSGGSATINAANGIDLVTNAPTLTAPSVSLNTDTGDINAALANASSLTVRTGGKFTITSAGTLTGLDVGADGVVAGAGGGSFVNANGGNQSMTVIGAPSALALNFKSSSGVNEIYRESSALVTGMTIATTGSMAAGSGLTVTAPAANITATSVALTSGGVQISTGGGVDLTSVSSGAGSIGISSSGVINVTSVSTGGGSFNANTNGTGANINVEKIVTTGGSVSLAANDGSIVVAGIQPLQIDTRNGSGLASGQLDLNAGNGNVGSGAAPLMTSGAVTLNVSARDEIAVVAANTPVTNLSVTTSGSGIGAVSVTNANYAGLNITRGAGDLTLSGVAPTTTGGFSLVATDGNLQVSSDITNVTTLTLSALTGDLNIAAGSGPRTIAASGNVALRAGNDVRIAAGAGALDSVSVAGSNIQVNAGRDFSLLGNGSSALMSDVGGFNTMSFVAGRDMTVQGGSGANAFAGIVGSANTFQQTFNIGGTFAIHGGTGAGSYAKVSEAYAFGSQSGNLGNLSVIGGDATVGQGAGAYAEFSNPGSQSFSNIRGDLIVAGGTATGNSALLSAGTSQTLGNNSVLTNSVTNAVTVKGGSGDGAFARVIAGSSQSILAAKDRSDATASGDIQVLGGSGLNASAELTAGTSQTVGDTRNQCFSSSFCFDPTQNVLVQGGTGNGALASVKAGSSQTVMGGVDISILGGSGTGANAEIVSTASSQSVGTTNTSSNDATRDIIVHAGSGGTASLKAQGFQSVMAGGDVLVWGGSGANMTAAIESTASSQSMGSTGIFSNDASNNVIVRGGSASGTAAWIKAATGQTIDAGLNIALSGGVTGASAEISTTAGFQTLGNLNSSSFDRTDFIVLAGGNGANSGAKISSGGGQNILSSTGIALAGGAGDGSGALILNSAGNQSINTLGGLAIAGGSGSAPGLNESGVRNSAGSSQSISASISIGLTGGGFGSDTWIKQQSATGAQTVSTSGALVLQAPTSGAGITSIDSAAGGQNISVGDVIVLTNDGGNTTRISSGANQTISADAVTVTLASTVAAGTRSEITATGNQLFTLNGGVAPATLTVTNFSGAGGSSARLMAGGTQTIAMNYFNAGQMQVGSTAGLGESLVQSGGNQTIVVGGLTVQGGATAAAKSKLQAGTPTSGAMLISTLNGTLQVLGGAAGPAVIDPLTLDGVSNGSILIAGGAGGTAGANVTAGSINMAATNGNMAVIGGGGGATVVAANTFNLAASGGLSFIPGSGGATISAPNGGNIVLGGACVGCATGLVGPFSISAAADVTDPALTGTQPNLNVTNIFYAFNENDEFGDYILAEDGTLIPNNRRRGLNQCY